MKKVFAVTAALALLGISIAAQAVVIDTVAVGDAGNAADTYTHSGNPAGQGSVSYAYNIGKYEVTAGQYTAFLNAVAKTDTYGLYNTNMDTAVNSYGCNIKRSNSSGNYSYSVASDWADRPVNLVSYWDACRFTNWLGNGQGSGDTETGAYTLNGYTGQDGRLIQRNSGWTWAVTSQDEWYKAAYYKGGGMNAGYWNYPTQNDATPGRDMADASGNNANYYIQDDGINNYCIGSPYYRTSVGEFENSDSAYGTFDQGGNVWEWNEAVVHKELSFTYRGLRGGSFADHLQHIPLQSSSRDEYYYGTPSNQDYNIGFRVSQIVPEPSSIIALLGGLAGLIRLVRRSR